MQVLQSDCGVPGPPTTPCQEPHGRLGKQAASSWPRCSSEHWDPPRSPSGPHHGPPVPDRELHLLCSWPPASCEPPLHRPLPPRAVGPCFPGTSISASAGQEWSAGDLELRFLERAFLEGGNLQWQWVAEEGPLCLLGLSGQVGPRYAVLCPCVPCSYLLPVPASRTYGPSPSCPALSRAGYSPLQGWSAASSLAAAASFSNSLFFF